MMLFSRPRHFCLAAVLMLPTLLCGCADDDQPKQFAPLRYDYLNQINLNVSSLSISDKTVAQPVEGDIGYKAPTPPVVAVRQMAEDRLAAKGTVGVATKARFVIEQASILHEPGGTLAGKVAVHLDIINPGGQRIAFAGAQATQTLHPDPSGNVESAANLYELTKDMMQTLNVEFEYEMRHSLSKWLVDAGGAPVGDAIQAQPLAGPGETTDQPGNVTGGAGNVPPVNGQAPALAPPLDNSPTVPANAPDTTVNSPAPAVAPAPASTPAPSAQDSEPNPVFPAGEDSSTPATSSKPVTKGVSPKAGFLKLPGQTTTGQ
ncbi:hypothetical protein K2X14_01030 [Acetobacter sp. TBRC 12305]|uniref:Lipoprotein n=1 Tax=Acetobacter garciniae TaxID=2817435 RepID=A0A939HKI8_9PROT|nr:hypothetical protein [Acetobacter garciniae]MBO1323736.1 hypothetical protein [Acetobacter garciniae]MBX0343425.1 hypothetical protein [Acetobacter garciniae]